MREFTFQINNYSPVSSSNATVEKVWHWPNIILQGFMKPNCEGLTKFEDDDGP